MERVGVYTDTLTRPVVCDHGLKVLGKVAFGMCLMVQLVQGGQDFQTDSGLLKAFQLMRMQCGCVQNQHIALLSKARALFRALVLGNHVSAAPTGWCSFPLTFSSRSWGQGTRGKLWHRTGGASDEDCGQGCYLYQAIWQGGMPS